MKKTNRIISILLSLTVLLTLAPSALASAEEKDTFILYTNDVHCAIEDYPVLAACRAELINAGQNVVVVDAGDAIQGEFIGSMTNGKAVADIMNAVGYDYAVPGNHEFDFGMDAFLDLANNEADYKYISSNFHYLPTVDPVFDSYAIEDFGDYQIAFVGISNPETIAKSTPENFKDENGNYVYGFPVYPGGMTDDILYENIQESVDSAIDDGADIVVAVSHTGILGTSDGWKSTDIIANTDGIDYYIDAHSHETIESATYKNAVGEDVILTSAGTKFANFGMIKISGNNADFELLNPDYVDMYAMSAEAKAAYNTVKAKVDGYNEEIAYLYDKIGTSEVKLVAYDSDYSWAVRKRETNAGDFVADAYRAVTGADVALVNGGGVRADVESGDISRKDLMDLNSFNNDMCVIEVTGQQLIDVLEHGARACPESLGSFFQVSGVSFEIHTYLDSPVNCDSLGNFISIDNTMERRVKNVYVGEEPIELDATYTLAGSQYLLLQGSGELTMLAGSTVVQKDGLPCDSEMLIKYFTENLNGVIPAAKYANPDGDGRITIVESDFIAPECDFDISYGEKITITDDEDVGVCIKFVPEKTGKYIFRSESYGVDAGATVTDSNGEDVSTNYIDDIDFINGIYDFILTCECEAGKTYYLNVFSYSGSLDNVKISSECGHSYENGVCSVCGYVCDHSKTGFLGYCPCGKVYNGMDISDSDEIVIANPGRNKDYWCRFIPDVSGYYSFKSVSEGIDPDCVLYDANGEWIVDSLDIKNMNFDLIYYFEAGKTYYFDVYKCSGEGAFSISLNRIIHTTEGAGEHTDFEIVEKEYSNCTEHGYTNGLYCNECEEFVYGHEELPLEPDYHVNENDDDICDLCNESMICQHICHSDNWFFHFIWTVANFIHSLLGISPVCECGEYHYE